MYDFNNHALRRFLQTIKVRVLFLSYSPSFIVSWGFQEVLLTYKIQDALDPDGILSPGKMGIWPARLRANKEKL